MNSKFINCIFINRVPIESLILLGTSLYVIRIHCLVISSQDVMENNQYFLTKDMKTV